MHHLDTTGYAGPASVSDALADHAVSLDTAEPDRGPDTGRSDLEPVADAFGDATIIGLGEATHGTREFFQLKDRLIRYLVTEEGLRLVGMESNFAETMTIDRYITDGEGTVLDAIENIYFWTWDTEEVVAMLDWLRDFNEGRSRYDQVRFWGFDMQFTAGAAAALEDYLQNVDPDALDSHADTLEMLQERDIRTDSEGDHGARLESTRDLVDDLRETLQERELEYIEALDLRAFDLARQHLRTIEQAHTALDGDDDEDAEAMLRAREHGMAENITWILDQSPHDCIALWAHNEHIRRGTSTGEWGAIQTMGNHLADTHGDEYYTLGFDFATGEFQALVDADDEDGYDLQACSFDGPPQDSLTQHLATLDEPQFFIDIDHCTTDDSLDGLLGTEQATRSVGAMFYGDGDDDHRAVTVPADVYDGLIFVQETTRAVPTERGS